ncbi:MAG TPA: helix-turn-helix domain-containing protein [Trebonia sp.]|nr:helix-turn-helix domain-containing protein [Trebonia sp.]
MTIGEALAEARYRAGLTIDELSERTKIREAVIRCIEQDDYAACGGDLYARGYVRAIAGAVGIDAQPLIRDFDAGHAGAAAGARNAFAQGQDLAGSSVATVPEPPTVIDMPAVADPDFAIADPEFSIEDPDFTIADPEFTFSDEEFTAAAEVTPAAATAPPAPPTVKPSVPPSAQPSVKPPVSASVKPRPPSAWRARTRSRRWVTGVAILVVIALAVAGFAGSRIVSHLRQHNAAGNAATVQQQKAANQPSPGTSAKGKPAPAKASKPTPAKKPKTHAARKAPRALPVTWLPIKLAMAFGPDGTADGDNPQSAQFAITDGAPSPWQTDWYASPRFGLLKSGTGLLLDMGRTVTITSMLIDLSLYRGADLQIRLGGTPSDLRVAARADDVGGTVRLKLSSARQARYVLIWFTLLPPNGAGMYQESVSRVVVNGRR